MTQSRTGEPLKRVTCAQIIDYLVTDVHLYCAPVLGSKYEHYFIFFIVLRAREQPLESYVEEESNAEGD